jgi:hypothetical protein
MECSYRYHGTSGRQLRDVLTTRGTRRPHLCQSSIGAECCTGAVSLPLTANKHPSPLTET